MWHISTNVMPTPSAYTQTNGRIGNKGSASLARHSKRKAIDTPGGNERLSKRLSLLNLGLSAYLSGVYDINSADCILTDTEAAGARLYVPVEAPFVSAPAPVPAPIPAPISTPVHVTTPAYCSASAPIIEALPKDDLLLIDEGGSKVSQKTQPVAASQSPVAPSRLHHAADDGMLVDDTKYKVYIHNIDDELSDDGRSVSSDTEALGDESSSGGSSGRLVFLRDIDEHLRSAARTAALTGHPSNPSASKQLFVPRPILPNEDGELAGMQLVLYNDPSSLSLPRESDSVRKAILDARARIRERLRETRSEPPTRQAFQPDPYADASMAGTPTGTPPPVDGCSDFDAMDID
ncbi:hypothetical protein SEPCBS57363_002503 [Sporothrix epigloea]|uniref:Uncharacterized protein n=1 Tax=Sporothrix epigloea TaxID=1892477 RepID=A0ABP0DGA1_9PEZI